MAFSPQYVNGIYIPTALVLIGVAITNRALLPYAVLFVAIVGGWKVYSGGKGRSPTATSDSTHRSLGSRKVLKPAEFQDFELEEKTVLSHNTAMYVHLPDDMVFAN
jgi:cytochrome-b5 reductase